MDTGLHGRQSFSTPGGQVRNERRSPPPAQPHATQPSSQPPNQVITLDQKRSGPRNLNLYVDTPRVSTAPNPAHSDFVALPQTLPVIFSQPASSPTTTTTSPVTSSSSPSSTHDETSSVHHQNQNPAGLKENHDKEAVDSSKSHTGSIFCTKCGKCKCKACTQPDTDWPPNKMVDCCSCLCCVQCVFYHCFQFQEYEIDDYSSADDPCACCERPHCLKRWTCMGMMSICLPCLCLYWPLRGLVSACTALHHRCSRRGCECRKQKGPSLTKRLLIPDSESSSH